MVPSIPDDVACVRIRVPCIKVSRQPLPHMALHSWRHYVTVIIKYKMMTVVHFRVPAFLDKGLWPIEVCVCFISYYLL